MLKKIFLMLFLSLAWTIQGNATPTITGVSGDITDGGTITIVGNEFGEKANASPLKWDNFEGGSNGAPISGWSANYGDPGPVYSNENQRTGSTLNYKAEIKAGDTRDYNCRLYYTPGSNLTKVYVSFWVRYDCVEGVEQQVKTWRLTDNYPYSEDASAAEFTYGENNARSYMAGASGCGTITEQNCGVYTQGVWTLMECEAQESTAGKADGNLHIWKSQSSGAISQELNSSTFKSRCSSDSHWLSAIFGQYAALTSGQSVTLYFDDIYIDNTWARVVFGDSRNYDSCTIREMQIPSEWSPNSITIKINAGSFAEGESAYLFVVDAEGNVSGGYPITIVSDEGENNDPPGDVTNFTAQAGDSQLNLSWTNPTDSDFEGTMIRFRTDGTHPANQSDGELACDRKISEGAPGAGENDSFTLTGLENGTMYYLSVFTYDQSGNFSQTVHASAMPCANQVTLLLGDVSAADFTGNPQDTYLNTNSTNYSSDTETLNTYTWPTNTVANRVVMKWDLSSIPQDAVIQEATLSLYMYGYGGTGGDDSYEISAHKIINHNPDISLCTWNTYDGSNSWTGGSNGGEQDLADVESSTVVDKSVGYKDWNIAQMVQDWVSNPSTNFGLMLNSDSTAASDSNRYFRPTDYSDETQRPKLTIKYCGESPQIIQVPGVPGGLRVADE